MSSDNHDEYPQAPLSYEDLWQTPVAQEMLQRHFSEQLQAGIFRTYNKDIASIITDVDIFDDENKERLILDTISAELPLVVAADTAGDLESPTIISASPLALVKIDPTTGRSLRASFATVAQIVDGVIAQLNGSFSQDQAALLLRHGNEQIAVGLHPGLVYNAGYLS